MSGSIGIDHSANANNDFANSHSLLVPQHHRICGHFIRIRITGIFCPDADSNERVARCDSHRSKRRAWNDGSPITNTFRQKIENNWPPNWNWQIDRLVLDPWWPAMQYTFTIYPISIPNAQVKTWFQNRRAKWRRCQPSHSADEKDHVTPVVPLNLQMNSQLEDLHKHTGSTADTFCFGSMNKWPGQQGWNLHMFKFVVCVVCNLKYFNLCVNGLCAQYVPCTVGESEISIKF